MRPLPWMKVLGVLSLTASPLLGAPRFEAPTPISPQGTIGDPSPTFTWKKVKKAKRYQLVVEGEQGRVFKKRYRRGKLDCAAGSCSVTPPGLSLPDGDYRWQIRAIGRRKRGAWGVQDFTVSAGVVVGNAFYVSPIGSDDGPGTEEEPWRSFRHVFSAVHPGDTVYVRGGDYPSEDLWKKVTVGGDPDALIVVKAYPGETPVLHDFGHFSLTTEYVRVEGLTFLRQGITAAGIGNQIVGNTFLGEGFRYAPIHVAGRNVLVENNTINVVQGSTLDHGIYVHSGIGITIRDNRFLRTFGYGVHVYGQNNEAAPIPLRDIVIEGNLFSGSERRDGIITAFAGGHAVDLRRVLIRNNVFVANGRGGVQLREGEGIEVYNNTFYAHPAHSIWVSNPVGSNAPVTRATISNNIIVTRPVGKHLDVGNETVDVAADTNPYWPTSAGIVGIDDGNGIVADPLFMNPESGDFRLSASSPGVDSGLSLPEVPTDRVGIPRPQGPAYDLGAYERP